MMIHVWPTVNSNMDAQLHCRHKSMSAIIGRNGITHHKHEGDLATPLGTFPLRQVFYRADRVIKPQAALPVIPLSPQDGWCDDPSSPSYNQHIQLPSSFSHETLWREDSVYDLIVVIGYNDSLAEPGKGSAIFMHLQRPNKTPTEGCVALTEADLRFVLASGATEITIHPPR
ncbi:L,D-transpeptidase family protein [Acetobacter pasteurianus]